MNVIIAYVVAAICVAGFVSLWFFTAYKEFDGKRNSLADIEKMLLIHKSASASVKDNPDTQRSAGKILASSIELYRSAAQDYNRTINKPVNYIPGKLMGFRTENPGRYDRS